ncbi:MAG: hypothetical protein R2712_10510 [Vicinamibacterales bacterium]
MRYIASTFILAGLMTVPLGAQRVPPGHMPPPGMCRVWYDNVPPGRQPGVTTCREAERVASRNRRARVIYGPAVSRDRYPNRSPYPGIPYPGAGRDRDRYPDRYPATRGRSSRNDPAWNQGFRDGLDKGREDAGDRDSFDPVRHSRYRSADHGYKKNYGPKDRYKLVYRDGFEAGYEEGYRSRGWRR